jgi:hypothetical protein
MFVLSSIVALAFVLLQAPPSSSATPAAAQPRQAGDAREMTLAVPHKLRKGETAWLLVEIGVIDHDQIQLITQDGHPLGTISPYSVRSGQAAGTYTVPVPANALNDGRLALRMSVIESGQAQRAPTTDEVKSLRLLIRRFRKRPQSGANP